VGRAGVVAGSAYFTTHSVADRKTRRRVCGSDQDAVTIAVEAGAQALAAWTGDPADIDGLFISVAHGPALAGPYTQVIREALGLSPAVKAVTFEGTGVGGIEALQGAIDAVSSGSLTAAVVIAAEEGGDPMARRSAGAAALVVTGSEDVERTVGVEELVRRSSLTHESWRPSAESPREPDFRFVQHRYRALAQAALEELPANHGCDDIVFAGGTRAEHSSIRATFPVADSGFRGITDAEDFGTAGPLVAILEAASAFPDRRVALVAQGGGQLVVLRLRTPAAPTPEFAWHDAAAGDLPPAGSDEIGPALSLPAESPFFARAWNESLRLEAAKCGNCGQIVYPPSQRTICPACRGRVFAPYRLPRAGTVFTHIDNRFLPTGFPARVVFVLGELEDGYRFWAPMPAEIRGEDVAIGDPVELRLRRYTVRDGLPVYGMKFVPAQPHEDTE
jgi:uncharacterized OB-fold protein